MTMQITLGEEVTASVERKLIAELENRILHDCGFACLDYEITRGDYTSIDNPEELSYASYLVDSIILLLIQEELALQGTESTESPNGILPD